MSDQEQTEILIALARLQTQMEHIATEVADIKSLQKVVEKNSLTIAVNAAKGNRAIATAVVSAVGAITAVVLRLL